MLKKVVLLIILICSALILSSLSVGSDPFGARDFFAFWSGGRVFLEGGNPYDDTTLKSIQVLNTWNQSIHSSCTQQFFNPSWTLPFFLILGFLPFKIATVFWIFIGLISLTLIIQLHSEHQKDDKRFILLGSILFIYVWYALMVGQLTVFILLLILYGARNFEKNGASWGSAIGTVGIFLKPHLFIPLVVWGFLNLKKQEYRALGCKSASVLLFLIFVSEWYHPGIFSLWINREGIPTQWISSTPAAMIQLYFSDNYFPPMWPLFLMPALGLMLSIFIYFKNSEASLWHNLPILLFLGVCFAPYAFPYDYVLCLPLILNLAINEKSKIASILVFLIPLVSCFTARAISNELHFEVIFIIFCSLILILKRWRNLEAPTHI